MAYPHVRIHSEWQLWKSLKKRNFLLMKWKWQLLREPKKSATAQVALQACLMKCLNFKNWYNSTDALYCRDNGFRYDVPEGTAWRFPKSLCVCSSLCKKLNIWSLKWYLNQILNSDFNFINRLKFSQQQYLLELLLHFHTKKGAIFNETRQYCYLVVFIDLRWMTSLS